MTPSHDSTFLRRALVADAALTGTTALMLTLGAAPIGSVLGLPPALLRGAGLSLLPFTALLVYLLRRDALPRAAVWFVVACNALWAIDSIVLLFTNWVDPTLVGQVFVVFQALVVAAFAEAQYMGLRRSLQASGSYTLFRDVTTNLVTSHADSCIIAASFPEKNQTEGIMPRRRKPAGLECLAELARKAAILERELSLQREAIERLMESSRVPHRSGSRDATATPMPSSPNWCPDTAR